MEALRTPFYAAICAMFLVAVSITSMLVTTGLAYAEQHRKLKSAVETITLLQDMPVTRYR